MTWQSMQVNGALNGFRKPLIIPDTTRLHIALLSGQELLQ
jgi:hypothetical protein